MEISWYLAQLIGPTLVVMGIGLLIKPKGFQDLADEFINSRALIFLAGVLAFVPGLAIVLSHNVWTADWRVIITILGWLAVIGGAVRILLPREVARIARTMLGRAIVVRVAGAAVVLVGSVLVFFGYFV